MLKTIVAAAFALLPLPAVACQGPVTLLEDHFATLSPIWQSATPLGVVDGALVIPTPASKSFVALASPRYADVDACADFSVTQGSHYEEVYPGLVFWAADASNLYALEYSVAGNVSVFRMRAGQWTAVLKDQPSPLVHGGLDTANSLRVVTAGTVATVFVNGGKVGEIKGQPPAGGQHVGFLTEAPQESAATFRFANLKVTAPQ